MYFPFKTFYVPEEEWKQLQPNISDHVDKDRCYELTQKGFTTNKMAMGEEKAIPSNPRQLRK